MSSEDDVDRGIRLFGVVMVAWIAFMLIVSCLYLNHLQHCENKETCPCQRTTN